MSDTTDTPRERKPLGLKRSIDAGEVKQTFSHGRTNKVVVEVKRRRVIGKPGEAPAPAPAAAPEPAPAPVAAPPPPPPPPPARKPAPSGETPQERVARLQREAEEIAEHEIRPDTPRRTRASDDTQQASLNGSDTEKGESTQTRAQTQKGKRPAAQQIGGPAAKKARSGRAAASSREAVGVDDDDDDDQLKFRRRRK